MRTPCLAMTFCISLDVTVLSLFHKKGHKPLFYGKHLYLPVGSMLREARKQNLFP